MADLTIPGIGAITPALADLVELADADNSNASGRGTLQQVLGLLASAIAANADHAAIRAALGFQTFKTTTAQTGFGTATLTDVTNATFTVVNGHYYQGRIFVQWRSDTLTSGPIFAMVHGSGAFAARLVVQYDAANTVSASAFLSSSFTGSAVAQTVPDTKTINSNQVAILDFTYMCQADGTLQLQMANEAAAGLITVRAGTTGWCMDMF